MRTLESYVQGHWRQGAGNGVMLQDAVTGEALYVVSSEGVDFAAMLAHGRETGGPALRDMTFHQRAVKLKQLAKYLLDRKEEFYSLSRHSGATRSDAWLDIEGGIGTLFAYSGKGRRELPNARCYLDGDPEPLSPNGTFVGQHVCVPLEGVAVHVNAYNFPCWGMLEKLGPTLLAGMPAVIKPASPTAYLAELMFRRMIESGIFPEGSMQLVCGGLGDTFEHLGCQDAVTFTGSAATARRLRQHPAVIRNSVRFTAEADSLNGSILGPDAQPGTPEFDLYVREVAREMTVKCGQRCTAIRRAMVPRALAPAVVEALGRELEGLVIGDPAVDGVQMGPLISRAQREEVRGRVRELARGSRLVHGSLDRCPARGVEAGQGAFLSPILLYCDDPVGNPAVHEIEAFGPVSTIVPYDDIDQLVRIARMGQGSLVSSVFTRDDEFARAMVFGIGAWHGRLLIVNRDCAGESTGHGSPLPGLVHGGPGRAGGGEELGGIRGVMHYMQRIALQGSPTTLSRVSEKWIAGAERVEPDRHPFRLYFDELDIGYSVVTDKRTVTLDDIEHFAAFTGDRFYAHMDEAAARANPFFEGRVAHGYFVVAAAAGLFVDPDPGPVLANYGLDNLRFTTPVYAGDTLQVTLTCKQKTAREGEGYGEVCWDCGIVNQKGDQVARYEVLTLVAKQGFGHS